MPNKNLSVTRNQNHSGTIPESLSLPDRTIIFKQQVNETDWKNTCDADGYQSPNFFMKRCESLRRMPQAQWFALIGSIRRQKQLFPHWHR